jgi:hypothetical protein
VDYAFSESNDPFIDEEDQRLIDRGLEKANVRAQRKEQLLQRIN